MAKQREKRDIYNHLIGGGLAGGVSSAVLGDFAIKSIAKRIIGVAVCAAVYSRAIRLEKIASDYSKEHGYQISHSEALNLFFSIDE